MHSVARYRSWALRGPFVLRHDNGSVKVPWPSTDDLLAYDPSAPTAHRLVRLAGDAADAILAATGAEDMAVLQSVLADLSEFFGCSRARRLVALIDRYGAAIASDLTQLYGIDVLGVFRGDMVPDELMDRIDGLPRHSRLSEALAQDDDIAELPEDVPSGAQEVRFTEWTPETERLATIADRLGDILSAIGSMAGAKINIPPQPRPAGASSRLQERRELDHYDEIVADVEAAHARWLAQQETTEEG